MDLKVVHLITFCFLNFYGFGQNYSKSLIGSWVMVNASYNSGEPLPLEHPLNEVYSRFTFKNGNKAFKTSDPLSNGYLFDYSVSGNQLLIGFVKYQIVKLQKDSLILIEDGGNGFNEHFIKYVFISEHLHIDRIDLNPDMLIVHGDDTLFVENEKVRAYFDTNQDFHDFLTERIPEYSNVVSSDNFFMATFIVTERGKVEKVEIHKGINPSFDTQFIQAVKSSSKYWKPAMLKQKPVKVLHTETYTFMTRMGFKSSYASYKDGIISMQRGEYESAIESFNKYLTHYPNDLEVVYQKGVAYYKMGQMENACEQWRKIDTPRTKEAKSLIKEVCK